MYPRGWIRDGRVRRRLALGLFGASALVAFSACSDSKSDAPAVEADPLAAVKWTPSFEPDYVNLTPVPGVDTATKEQQDLATVADDHLEFPSTDAASVRDWQPGKVIVAAPGSTGAGTNPFGYARRVVSVTEVDGKLVVATEKVGIQDIVEGEFQLRGDTAGTDVDISKIDPDWLAQNLYGQDSPIYFPDGIEPLKSDDPTWLDADGNPVAQPGSGWGCCSFITKAVSSAASSVASTVSKGVSTVANGATNLIAAITPTDFTGSAGLTSDISFPQTSIPLFKDMEFKKTIKRKSMNIELFIKGQATVSAALKLNPGFQVGARIPNPINKNAPAFKTWMNIDSRVETHLGLDLQMEAGIRTVQVDGKTFSKGTKEFAEKVEKNANYAQEVYAANREELLGDEDMKPEATFTKVLWISTPKTQVFTAGPVPVVLTSTLQVNLVCGFEAKASINAKLSWDNAQTFKFAAEYESGKGASVPTAPTGTSATSKTVQVTGGGEAVVHCGLVPRVNAFVYDTVGIYAGIRGSLVAKAKYESKCEGNETTTTPKASVSVSIDGNVGIQLGGRVQVPGSSFAGKSAADLGFDSPPLEPYNKSFNIYSKEWDFDTGIGYCTPLCENGKLDGTAQDAKETDVDCGGGACNTCATGKKCLKSSDCTGNATCNGGVCKLDPCSNGVRDGSETGVDCGGTCTLKCATDQGCQSGADCTSGFCSKTTLKCVPTSCTDGIKDGNENGVDCGGSCGKCATGVACTVATACASGFSNGTNCVATSCEDRVKSGGESDRDCGGTSSCFRCAAGLACAQSSDCAGGLQCTGGKCVVIPAPTCSDRIKNQNETDLDCGGLCGKCDAGKRCGVAGDCASAICSGSVCQAARCDDSVKNGNESGVDCGGTSTCARCGAGKTCSTGTDCSSGACLSGVCGGSFTVGGTVSGLATGGTIVLKNNGGDSRSITQNGAFTFGATVAQASAYAVTIGTQPTGQTCAVASATGTVPAANVTGISVTCTPNAYNLGGTVSGLVGSITLRNNGGNDVTLTQSGNFTFPAKVSYLGTVAVTTATQPLGQACTVTGGSGTMGAADIGNVSIACTSNAYTVGGSVSGLKGSITLRNNGGDSRIVTASGSFTFPTTATYGNAYTAAVFAQPAGQTCTVAGGAGTVTGNVTGITVSCTDNSYTVGGAVSGLTGTVTLQNNGGNTLGVTQNGTFTFTQPVTFTSAYAVTISGQPANQTCVVAKGSGTMDAGNVTNVAVTCTTNTYSLGGSVSGLAGGSVVLQNNGGANLTVNANGSFVFGSPVAQGSTYQVSVLSAPAGQTCTVNGASGTVGAGNVSDVTVGCTTDAYTVGGTIGALTGTIVLQLNGAGDLSTSANGTFSFPQPLAYNTSYTVSIKTQPSGGTCSLVNASGTLTNDVTNVGINCSGSSYTVGGNVSGLVGTLGLQDNGGNDLSVTADGSFTFSQAVPSGNPYAVTISAQPARRACVVTNGTGTVGGANVTNVTVACTPSKRLVFVSNTTGVGLYGGVFGADGSCQNWANNASLGGTFKAWISDQPTSNPPQRFTMSSTPYVRVDGVTVANDWAGLTSGTLLAPISVTETGLVYTGKVWTSTTAAGNYTGDVACNGWTKFTTAYTGGVGSAASATSTWSSNGTQQCNAVAALYCVEQ